MHLSPWEPPGGWELGTRRALRCQGDPSSPDCWDQGSRHQPVTRNMRELLIRVPPAAEPALQGPTSTPINRDQKPWPFASLQAADLFHEAHGRGCRGQGVTDMGGSDSSQAGVAREPGVPLETVCVLEASAACQSRRHSERAELEPGPRLFCALPASHSVRGAFHCGADTAR